MSLNSTPTSDRIHIGIFGKRNAGKSSVINALTNQKTAIVSHILGTTTDPVYKSMELLPLGPVVIIDTPGLDDTGELGILRVNRANMVLNKTDIALVVADAASGITKYEQEIISKISEKNINKSDLIKNEKKQTEKNEIYISALTGEGINELKEKIAAFAPADNIKHRIVGDLLEPMDFAVLVVPIDSAAPKGRLILPQQQTIRDILEAGAVSIVCRESELRQTLNSLGKKPKIVICDSQVFSSVSKDTPEDIFLTSFSILFARYKGNINDLIKGAKTINELNDGDKILISEGCTHHRQCDDIGTVKIPRWIKQYTGKDIIFDTSSGGEFPDNLTAYKLIVHCGGCMLNEKEMKHRIKKAKELKIPIVNYGILIAYINGILKRSLECFPDLKELL